MTLLYGEHAHISYMIFASFISDEKCCMVDESYFMSAIPLEFVIKEFVDNVSLTPNIITLDLAISINDWFSNLNMLEGA